MRRGLFVSARIHFLLGLGSSHVQLSENQFIILDNKYTKWLPATAIKYMLNRAIKMMPKDIVDLTEMIG